MALTGYPVSVAHASKCGLGARVFAFRLGWLRCHTAQVDHDPLKFYFEDNPLRVGIETLDEHVAGAGSMSVLVERDGGVKDLALLQKMESFEKRLREYKNPVTGKHLVTGVASLLNVIKETNRALNEGTKRSTDCRTLSVVFRMRCSFLRTPVLTIRVGFLRPTRPRH